MHRFRLPLILLLVTAGIGFTVLGIADGRRSAGIAAPDFRDVEYTGSAVCHECHQDRHRSWHQTFHRTMTQDADENSVLGAFDGRTLSAWGVEVIPERADGEFRFRYRDPQDGRELGVRTIQRTVGSHRYQQYLSLDPESGAYWRLQYLWHVEEQRWVHMNAAFLGTDSEPFDAELTIWNIGCVHCHNTGARPQLSNLEELEARQRAGETLDALSEAQFETETAELGISCETCHAPAAVHVELNQSFWRRQWLAFTQQPDPSIVNPARLSADAAVQVCASCHAGRTLPTAAHLQRWVTTGTDYRAGGNLHDAMQLVWSHTPSPDPKVPDLIERRFWPDGAPRLTAYEYQGMVQSACYQEAEFSCSHCHTMHGGDPAGMLPEVNRGNRACARCHEVIAQDLAVHSGHAADGAAGNCYACHMPKSVYGVMNIHMSHRIEIPDPAVTRAGGRPNACMNCHQDRSPNWLAEAYERLYKQPMVLPDGPEGLPLNLADGPASLLGGDPVRQAVAAYVAGQDKGLSDLERVIMVPWLIEAMADHRPAVRRFAWRSLRSLDADLVLGLGAGLARFDYTGASESRSALIADLRTAWLAQSDKFGALPSGVGLLPDGAVDPEVLEALRKLAARQDYDIKIGE